MKAEPHKIKTIKNLYITTQLQRSITLREAGLNTFNIHSDCITYDLVSLGTSAKSQEQESGSLIGDETYAGSRNFEGLVSAVNQILGHQYVCPTHNLLGALKLLTKTMVKPGAVVYSNSHYPELLVNQEKGILKSLGSTEDEIYKGDVKISELKGLLSEGENAAFIYFDLFADGYRPVSFQQLQQIRKMALSSKIKLVLNVSCVVELAVLYQAQNPEFRSKSLKDIVKELWTPGKIPDAIPVG